MRPLSLVALFLMSAASTFAADILTVPTANQLKQGEIDLAYYYVVLAAGTPAPEFCQIQMLYVGITDWLEIDAQRQTIDNDETSVILIGSVKLLSESATKPDLVFGCRNMAGSPTTDNPPFTTVNYRDNSTRQSFFLCSAKTWFLGRSKPGPPGPPFIRLHLSLGNPDWTIGQAERHNGFFGGVECVLTQSVGLVLFNDERDLVTGVGYTMPKTGASIRLGTFGPHWWTGLAYRWTPRW